MDPRDLEVMKADMADLAVRLHSVDARLDFTEQLLGGALSGARPPEPLLHPQILAARGGDDLDVETSSDGEDTSPEAEDTSTDEGNLSDGEDVPSDEGDTSLDAKNASG